MASEARSCSNPDCRFATDGKCIEGYPLDDCPHLRRLTAEEIEEVSEAAASPEVSRAVTLAPGEALDREQTALLQRKFPSRAIGLIGPNNAGKTSLIAAIFDLFQDGPIAEVGFAGSSTLIGFEKICHDARAASRRGVPHMERTSVGADAAFYHLDIKSTDNDILSIFIGDRSGEDYLGATDEISRAQAFFELRRADAVTLLVNGDHLAGSEHRHEAKAIAPQVVDALVEAGAIRTGARLAIVMTKEDLVLASPNSARAKREFGEIVTAIRERHKNHFGEVEDFTVAASPADIEQCPRGQGLDKLLHFWLRPPRQARVPIAPAAKACRMIDQFGERNGIAE
jgi:GTPase SAR1 family protein